MNALTHQASVFLLQMQVWDLEALAQVSMFVGHCKPVLKLQHQPNRIFSIGGSSIRVWDIATGLCRERYLTSRSAGTLRALCVTRELDIIVGCQDTTIKLYRFGSPKHGAGSPNVGTSQQRNALAVPSKPDAAECMLVANTANRTLVEEGMIPKALREQLRTGSQQAGSGGGSPVGLQCSCQWHQRCLYAHRPQEH